MTTPQLTSRPRRLRGFRAGVLMLVAMLAAALGVQAGLGSANAAPAVHQAASVHQAAALATVHGCPYYDLCLYEGYNFGGTIHRMYNCQIYYTPYYFHSAVNNQSPGTRASFRDYNNVQFFLSPAPVWQDGNTDNNAGNLGLRTWYVKPC
jgi:hypothetical protein